MIMYSIVIPAYNAELYISEMIKSVISQTYNNWELIIIDDGSTDNTGKICDEYANDQIKVYHNENKGQIGARIDGIFKASGDYTLVVDADDRLQIDCLDSINQVLVDHKYDCVAFRYSIFDEKMHYIDTTISPKYLGEISKKDFLIWIIETLNHPLYNKVFRTEILQAGAGEAIRNNVSINGDYALVIPVVSNAEEFYYLDKSLYEYRVLKKSISHYRTFKQVIDTDVVSGNVVEILKIHGLLDEELNVLVFKQYLNMIEWLLCEINNKRFILFDEINELHKREFYKSSLLFETKENCTRKQLVILRSIRKEGRVSLLYANILMKMFNFLSKLLSIKLL